MAPTAQSLGAGSDSHRPGDTLAILVLEENYQVFL